MSLVRTVVVVSALAGTATGQVQRSDPGAAPGANGPLFVCPRCSVQSADPGECTRCWEELVPGIVQEPLPGGIPELVLGLADAPDWQRAAGELLELVSAVQRLQTVRESLPVLAMTDDERERFGALCLRTQQILAEVHAAGSLEPAARRAVLDLFRAGRRSELARTARGEGSEEALRFLQDTRVATRFHDVGVDDWANFYGGLGRLEFAVSPRTRLLGRDRTGLRDFALPEMTVAEALLLVGAVTGVAPRIRDGDVELLPRRELARSTPVELAGVRGAVRDAVTALGMLGAAAERAIPVLEPLAGHDDPQIAERARAALRQIGGG